MGKSIILIASIIISALQTVNAVELEPVWSVTISGENLHLEKNEFNRENGILKNHDFPISSMILYNNIPPCGERENERALIVWCTAPLNVRKDGSAPNTLYYYDPDEYKFSFVNEFSPLSAISIHSKIDSLNQRKELFNQVYCPFISSLQGCFWNVSPDGLIGILQTENESFIINPITYELINRYEFQLRGIVFNSEKGRFAAIANHERQNQIVLFSYQGDVIFEERFWYYGYWELFLMPNGREILCARYSPSSGVKIVCMDINDRIEGEIGAMDHYEPMHCSENGEYMLVTRRISNQVDYFNIKDPFNPIKLWDYKADNRIISASITNDGSLVALHVMQIGSNRYKRIVVLNKDGNEMAQAHNHMKKNISGLRFIDKYLIVGFPKAEYLIIDSKQIDIFRLENN